VTCGICCLLSNSTCKYLEMNAARIFCYSLAVKGFSPFSGANHALAANPAIALWLPSHPFAGRVAEIVRRRHTHLHMITGSKDTNRTLLILGILSLALWPFTAVPGILIGRRHTAWSSTGRFGYVMCWLCLGLFCLQMLGLLAYFILFEPRGSALR